MDFKDWALCEEIFPNGTATVFHRTHDPSDIEEMIHAGFETGPGIYGKGLYSTFSLESQFQPYMERYGRYIVKFKVERLGDFLITPINVAKYIIGGGYRISDQFRRHAARLFGPSPMSHNIPMRIAEELGRYDKMQSENRYTGELAIELSNIKWTRNFAGIIYNGQQDGYCLLKHEPVNDGLTMLGYAIADHDDHTRQQELASGKGWTTDAAGGKIKHLYGTGKKHIEAGDEVFLLKTRAASDRDFLNKTLKVLSVKNDTAEVETNGWERDDKGYLMKIKEIFPLSSLYLKKQAVPRKFKLGTT